MLVPIVILGCQDGDERTGKIRRGMWLIRVGWFSRVGSSRSMSGWSFGSPAKADPVAPSPNELWMWIGCPRAGASANRAVMRSDWTAALEASSMWLIAVHSAFARVLRSFRTNSLMLDTAKRQTKRTKINPMTTSKMLFANTVDTPVVLTALSRLAVAGVHSDILRAPVKCGVTRNNWAP